MNKSMKPKATIPPMPKMTEEEKKEQFMRAYIQKKASLAEGILFNLCQNPSIHQFEKSIVVVANEMAEECMKVIYKQDVNLE